MRHAKIALLLAGVLAAVCFLGCGKAADEGSALERAGDAVRQAGEEVADSAAEMADSAAEMVEDVTEMTPEQIQAKVEELKTKIADKESELGKIAEKLKKLSPTDLAGDGAKKLQQQSDTLTEELQGLKDKLSGLMG